MLTASQMIPNALGLHTRAASKLVDCACRYQSNITLKVGGKNANAKRIMEVMTLGAKQHDQLDLEVLGDDQQEAMAACMALVQSGFGELA